MPILDIKCGKFCPYNKKLFCPFYYVADKEELPEVIQETEVIPTTLVTKKFSIKPSPKTRKKKSSYNQDDSDGQKFETVWMNFFGEISNSIFTANFSGNMTDLKLGEFSGKKEPSEEDNFSSLSFNGRIYTSDKNSDFGGEVEIELKISYEEKDDKGNTVIKTTNYLLKGKFNTCYKRGGTVIQPEDGKEYPESEEKFSNKFYDGTINFNNEKIFDGTINFYTDM